MSARDDLIEIMVNAKLHTGYLTKGEYLPEAEKEVDTLLSEILMWVVCNRDLMEAGRKHLEDMLIELRDDCIGIMGRGNGFTVNDKDGTPSPIMRLGTPEGLRLALEAMARSLAGN